MKITLKAIASSALGAAVIGSFASSAMATGNRTMPAISGMADIASEQACFNGSWNGVVNTCSSPERWDVPIPVDPTYGLTLYVGAQLIVSGAAANVGCQAQAVSYDYKTISTTGWVVAGGVSETGPEVLGVGDITVPSYDNDLYGTASLACFIPSGTILGAVQY